MFHCNPKFRFARSFSSFTSLSHEPAAKAVAEPGFDANPGVARVAFEVCANVKSEGFREEGRKEGTQTRVRAAFAGSLAHIWGQAVVPGARRAVAPTFSTRRDVLGNALNRLASITPKPAARI